MGLQRMMWTTAFEACVWDGRAVCRFARRSVVARVLWGRPGRWGQRQEEYGRAHDACVLYSQHAQD